MCVCGIDAVCVCWGEIDIGDLIHPETEKYEERYHSNNGACYGNLEIRWGVHKYEGNKAGEPDHPS
ncbi:hypothetical protein NECAME_11586 [Necator americanus]|uniref:Uncharacterized protein n=1 Tax=Necator americanus TaxID=51031 RepID=W2T5W2_NECAM|nr:hypothetical protein NECAME_11586 [Necator americanus]ETN76581.1 hypothetical protein NECAME_11586 [Necator americanus]